VTEEFTILVAAVSCGSVVVLAEPVTISLLRRAAAMDVPSLRSSHTVPTLRGGGAPIAVGLVLAALLIRGPVAIAFMIAVAAFSVIGLIDDLTGLSVRYRLALQGLASLAAAIALLSHLSLPSAERAAGVAVIALWVTSFVNAFNFMDGVNGISAAHAMIGGAAFAFLGAWRHDVFLAAGGAAVAAGALAFLPWNAFRARVFLGDVGSYGLGAALAVLAACAVIRGIPVEAVLGPLALYLADTAWTLQRRIRSGAGWSQAHRTHIYQQWCDAGWSHQRVTVVTSAGTLLLCLLGAASLTGQPAIRSGADVVAIGVLVVYLRSPVLLRRTTARLERVLGAHPAGDPLLPTRDRGSAGAPVRTGRNLGGRRGQRDRADRYAEPSDGRGAARVPGRDPAAGATRRLPGSTHLGVRNAERGHRAQDPRAPELHDQQLAARLAPLRSR
jgi:UDP-N-acetylmuramyl pentapeptide phosphotransferase/UDP-N-acetylglucosamine-1-phosphate transferase